MAQPHRLFSRAQTRGLPRFLNSTESATPFTIPSANDAILTFLQPRTSPRVEVHRDILTPLDHHFDLIYRAQNSSRASTCALVGVAWGASGLPSFRSLTVSAIRVQLARSFLASFPLSCEDLVGRGAPASARSLSNGLRLVLAGSLYRRPQSYGGVIAVGHTLGYSPSI